MTERSHSGTTVAAVILVIMVGGLLYRYWPGEERDIRRHLSNLAEALSVSTAESEPLNTTRFAALREYFAPEVRLSVDGQTIETRDAILGALAQWMPPPGGVGVEFVDITVALSDDGASARVSLTAKVSTNRVPVSESTVETRTVKGGMSKREGDWVIVSAEAGPAH